MRSWGGNHVIFHLPERDVLIHLAVLQQHLPQFPRSHRSEPWDYRNYSHWSLPGWERAFRYILKHLTEIQQDGASSSLLNSLEDLWKKDRRHMQCLHQDDSINTFKMLGHILAPKYYGCSNAIFNNMCTFFTRHFDEIMQEQHGSPVWPSYVSSLSYTKHDIIPTLSLLTDYEEQVVSDLHKLQYRNGGWPDSNGLSNELRNSLDVLFDQKDRHDHGGGGQEVAYYGSGAGGGADFEDGWALAPISILQQRRSMYRGNSNRVRSLLINGQDLDFEELCARWQHDPGSITVDEGRMLLRGRYEGCMSNGGGSSGYGSYRQPRRLLPPQQGGLRFADRARRTLPLRRRR